MRISTCPNIICWKDYCSPLLCLDILVRNLLIMHIRVYLWTFNSILAYLTYMSILCLFNLYVYPYNITILNYWIFVLNLKINVLHCSPFSRLLYSVSVFPCDFRISLPISTKMPVGTPTWNCTKSQNRFGEQFIWGVFIS